jgi:hypothetical protein
MKNIHVLPIDKEPIKGDLLLRHIWKGTSNECISWWRYNDTTTIDGVTQYTTLNGSFRDITSSFITHNIYITSDEKPKQGDWVFDTFRNACPIIRQLKTEEEVIEVQKTERKIILAADPKLIKDGVQAIGDEFLEWFTKNYKIENIEVNIIEVEDYVCSAGHTAYPTSHNEYKIIIPLTESVKEEPKHYPDS